MAGPTEALPERPKTDKKDKKTKKVQPKLKLDPEAPYIKHRIDLFEKLKKEYDEDVAKKPREEINISLPDGKVQIGKSWETTPGFIARNISKSLYERIVVAQVNGEVWDLERPLEGNCQLEFLDFDHPEGKKVFWHSSAHILGEAAELKYGCNLCIGPPIDTGFYYEMGMEDREAVSADDYAPLTTLAEDAIKQKQDFQRLTLSKENLLEMFKSNKYKQHIIKDKIPDGTDTTVYRCGPLIDLCRGPHVPHTGRIKTFAIMKNSASYFLGDPTNDSLQRIYGVSFPTKEQMADHKKYLEEAAARDHRKIGQEQDLFFFNDLSPGACFFLPHGTIIYNALQQFLRDEYWKRGYQEVSTPNMFNSALWKQSGHWKHYDDDMFTLDVEKDKWALKPMNCPGHALLFDHRERSYRELPMRIAEFGVLHRNEASGALTGLTRVRRFVQDDCHIFCTEEQIESEILDLFDFLQTVYGNFGFTFKLKLSTRPENYLGEIETWDRAEAKLRGALDSFAAQGGVKWELNPGDGAFYGPKIDVTISDALKRDFQCATLQLDFQLPQQFNLEYMTPSMASQKPAEKVEKPHAAEKGNQSLISDANGEASTPVAVKAEKNYRKPLSPGCARPVMIHRAIYGSFERFIAILTEHFAGRWPFWLSPRQVLVIPVHASANEYTNEVRKIFRDRGMHVDVDVSGNTLQKKIRTGQLSRYNFIFVVGQEEMENRTVNIRDRDDMATQARGELIKLDDAIEKLETLRKNKTLPVVESLSKA